MTKKSVMLILGVIIMIGVICAGADLASAEYMTVILEEDTTSFIQNPAMGWVIYVDAFGGFPNARQYWYDQEYNSDKASILYIRAPWSQFEPIKGDYAWNNDDNYRELIQGAQDRGLKLAFRVYVDSQDSYQQATPDYVRQAGAKGYKSRYWTPYVNDPVFQGEFEQFLSAFALEYDDPDVVDYIDAQGLGWWGEMHHLEYLSSTEKEQVYRWIVEAYSSRFGNVLLGAQYGSNSFPYSLQDWALESKGFVIRRDSFGSSQWLPPSEKERILRHWPKVPVFAENCYHSLLSWSSWWKGDGFRTLRDVLESVLNDAKELHANTLDLRIPEDARAWYKHEDLVEDFALNGGYRFVLVSVRYPGSICPDREYTISHTWKNTAIGKLPNDNLNWNYKYRVAFAILDPFSKDVKQMIISDAEASDWLKRQDYSYTTAFIVEDIPTGVYDLGVAIVDKTKDFKPAIDLAIRDAKTETGWYHLAAINVKSE